MKGGFKKLKILFALSFIFLFFSFNLVSARELEVNYPEIFGLKPTAEKGLEVYGKYLFNLSVLIIGLVLFGSLVWGGITYLTSVGDPGKMKDARERIVSSFFGAILLLSSYWILTTINPQLAVFKLPTLETLEKKTPKVEITKFEKQTQIFYEIPLGQMLENGLWEKGRTDRLSALLTDFENFLTAPTEGFEKVSDLYKHLSVLTEDCHCEELEGICLKPKNFAIPAGCMGDPCKKVRDKIKDALDKSAEISNRLKAYKKEIKNLENAFEEEGRKYRNLEEILENCKKRELLTRAEYYQTVDMIYELGGSTKLIKSYLPSQKDDPLVFYCTKGGTIFDYPYKIPEISEEDLKKAEEVSPPGTTGKSEPLSCPGYIPIGSLLDDELTSISFETNASLDLLVYHIDKILEEITKMVEAVSECNESRCNVSCACVPNPCYEPACGNPPSRTPKCGKGKCTPPTPLHPNFCYFFCDSPCLQTVGGCHGEPCPREKLKEIPMRIKKWEEEIFNIIEEINSAIEDAKVMLGEKEGKVTLPAEGKINILEIRKMAEKCLNLSAKSLEKPEEGSFWAMLRCDLALGQRGPDGKPILSCHPNDFFCCSNKPWDESAKEFPEKAKVVPEEKVLTTSLPSVTSSPSLACDKTNYPYFGQYEKNWATEIISSPGCIPARTMRRAGCALTSLAMILANYGLKVDPLVVAKTHNELNLWVCGQGSAAGFPCTIVNKLAPGEFSCETAKNFNDVVNALKSGKSVLFGGRGHPPYLGGESENEKKQNTHYLVLTKLDKNWGEEIIYYNDPGTSRRRCGALPEDYFKNRMYKAYIIGKK